MLLLFIQTIYYQKDGQTYLYEKGGVPVGFKDIGRLRMLIEKLCMLGYARIDESNPGAVFSAQGMRITALIPPIYCVGDNECTIAIRKFVTVPTLKEMIKQGSISEPAAIFMEHAARGKMTIGFAGPMNSGKTTQIAVLGRYFDADGIAPIN
jgi:pilus assembly protein CpaF